MTTVFREILHLLKIAEQRGIPPEQVTFSMSRRGMLRYRAAAEQIPGAERVLSRLAVTCDPGQDADIALGPPPS